MITHRTEGALKPRLVGRTPELRRLRRLLTEPNRRSAVLVGPAGVGKTRLADQLAASARLAGWTVVRARGSRSAATIPLGAFAHLLPDDPGPAASRLEILHSCVTQLTRLAEGARLLVVVDDAHHLDDASATLTHLLASASPAVTLVTMRLEEPSPDPVTAIWLDGHAERIDLEALNRDDADELVSVLVGGAVDRGTLAELWRLTEGNALLTVELVRAARDCGALQRVDGIWRHVELPGRDDRLAAVIESRLDHLEAAERAALELLAVGEPVPLRVLERAADVDAIARLEEYGLVDTRAEGLDTVIRSRHPLYGEVLRDRMPRTRVRAAARTLADALETLGPARRDDLFRLALWRLEAGDSGDAQRLTEAARRAVELFEYELAHRLASAAVAAGGDGRAHLALAEALAGLGHAEEAELELARIDQRAAGPELARVAVPRAWNLAVQLGDGAAALEVLRRAAGRSADPEVTDEIIATEATLHSFLGDVVGALEASRRILERPGASDRSVVQALTISTAATVLRGRPNTAWPELERGLRIADSLEEPVPLASTKLIIGKVMALEAQGRLVEAERTAQATYLDAIERGAHHEIGGLGTTLAFVLLARGRIAEVGRVVAETTVALERADPLAVASGCAAIRALALALSGDLAGTESALSEHDDRFSGSHRFSAITERALAWLHAQRGRIDRAVELALSGATALRQAEIPIWAGWLLHDVVRFGRPELAAEPLDRLADDTEGDLLPALAAHAAATASGDSGRLEAAAEILAGLGADLVAAEAFDAAARIHRLRGREELARKAERRSRGLAHRCVGARTLGLVARPAQLTPRQHEVAHLAADGLTNREISERLQVSIRTVDNHLAQVYTKLGVAGRGELAGALRGDQLAPGHSTAGR